MLGKQMEPISCSLLCFRSLVVRPLGRYSRDQGSSQGKDISYNKKLIPLGGRPCKCL